MLSEKLKKQIGNDELSAQVDKILGDKIVVDIVTNDGDAYFIPKERFDQVNTKVGDLETAVKTKDAEIKQLGDSADNIAKELKTLKESGADVETIQAKVTELEAKRQEEKTEWEKEKKQILRDQKVKDVLTTKHKVDPEYADFVMGRLNMDSVVLSEDMKTVSGVDEQITEDFRKSNAKFLTGKQITGQGHNDGTPGGGPGSDDPPEGLYSREELKNLTEDQYLANREKAQKSMTYHGTGKETN